MDEPGGDGRPQDAEFRNALEREATPTRRSKLDSVILRAPRSTTLSRVAAEALIQVDRSDPNAEYLPRRRPWD